MKSVAPQTTMRELHQLFAKGDFNGYPEVSEGKLLGIVSKFDFLNRFAFTRSSLIPRSNELMDETIDEGMTEDSLPLTPPPSCST